MSWDGFLKSLESEGGKMLVLILMIMFIVVSFGVMIATGHPPQEAGRQAGVSTVSALFGILFGYLKSSGKT